MTIKRPNFEGAESNRITLPEMMRMVALRLNLEDHPGQWHDNREYFQKCAWAFWEASRMKTQAQDLLKSAKRCSKSGEQAMYASFEEEAAACYITSAHIYHKAYSMACLYNDRAFSKRILIDAYEGLSMIRKMPDGSAFWQNRLAEVAAALLPIVAAVDHSSNDVIRIFRALHYVSQAIQFFVPRDSKADIHPLQVAQYYSGGTARVHAALAHTEIIGRRYNSAYQRIKELLSHPIMEPDDRFYALMVGLSASRSSDEMDDNAWFLNEIRLTINKYRDAHRTFEGRVFEMEQIFHQMQTGTEPWAIDDLHHAEDLFNVIECLKARTLLDDLSNCRIRSVHPDAGQNVCSSENLSHLLSGVLEQKEDSLFRDLKSEIQETPRDILEEMAKLSFWSFASGGGSNHNSNPMTGFRHELYLEKRKEFLSRENQIIPEQGGYSGSADPHTVDEIQDALFPDELLIEYYIPRDPGFPNRYCRILIISKEKIAQTNMYFQGQAEVMHEYNGFFLEKGPIGHLCAAIRASILRKDDDGADAFLGNFFKWFIDPVIRKQFVPERFKRWIIVPHGPLHLIPFHAAIDDDGKRLIERVPITTVPSASVWLKMQEYSRNPVHGLFAAGNPSLPESFRSLPDAQDEVQRISEMMHQPPKVKVIVNADASETKVKEEMINAGMLHFATHGVLDWRNPKDGHRMLFSKDEANDGLLSAVEIREMDLRQVRLVILNVCNGATCRYGGGDEPLGLLSAFISAGAENVMGGIWDLPDAYSKLFILQFYKGLAQGDPAAAFQHAAVNAIKRGKKLFAWSGHQLIGPGRSFQIVPPSCIKKMADNWETLMNIES